MAAYTYDQAGVVLRGMSFTDYFLGPPNYGETPSEDYLEHAVILSLDEPIELLAPVDPEPETPAGVPYASISRVQLAGHVDLETLRMHRGRGVELSGSLFHAHTGHHHERVLLSVDETPPRPIDDREVYPGAELRQTGTGYLLGTGGYLVTNAHVIADTLGVTVTRGLLRMKASVEYVDPDADIAILRIPTDRVPGLIEKFERCAQPLRLWPPSQLGERLYVFGFPLRPILPHSLNMTEGIVSAETGNARSRFQISAAIQKGNSGGPVFDASGNLIGIVCAKLPAGERYVPENVNFALRLWDFLDACKALAIDIREGSLGDPINPVVLAKNAQQLCFEVECWEMPASGTTGSCVD